MKPTDNTCTHNVSFRVSRLAICSFWAVALGVCFFLPGFASADDLNSNQAATGPTLAFGPVTEYDNGVQTAVAAHRSGLFIEFHQTQTLGDQTIWYRLGRIDGSNVVWGRSQKSGLYGYWPTAAISREGYVLVVVGNKMSKNGSQLYYQVGKIDPYGGVDQSLAWLTQKIHWDAGFHARVAMNDSGLIVGVHETGHSSTGMYYRVGHFLNPTGGDFTIRWDSGQSGVYYNDGINPHIALNNRNQIVAVHQVPGDNLLHYWRGTVSNGRIQFAASRRYHNNAKESAVVLLDNGVVLEAHVNVFSIRKDVVVTIGILRPNDPALIEWGSSHELFFASYTDLAYPALATDGAEILLTFGESASATSELRNAVGRISYANGTLIRGSNEKVYVLLNEYRYHIPNPATFDALGYQWDKILRFYDDEINIIPEGAPFPVVAPKSGPLNYPNGTLIRGVIADKVYVVLNNHRHWIPDPATFDAMGYDYDKILRLNDSKLNAIPEGGRFPSVAR